MPGAGQSATCGLVACDAEARSKIAFQPARRGQPVSRSWSRTQDVSAMRADLESRFGKMVHCRALLVATGWVAEVVRKPVYKA
jgi:hypothetical protein